MKKVFVTLLLVLNLAYAQYLNNNGVERSTDEFTNDSMCYQLIDYGDISMSLVNYNNDPNLVAWFIFINNEPQVPFNIFVAPTDTELVMVKLTDDVRELMIGYVETEFLPNGNYWQGIALSMEPEYMRFILSHEGEIRIRLDGDNYNYDFTFDSQMRILFRTEFFMECVPSAQGG